MPRLPVVQSDVHPFHVTGRCINRDWFKLPLSEVWAVMEDYLFLINAEFGLRIHAFVLMSNHFHLLLTTPNANLSEAMAYFMGRTARELTSLSGRINQTYGCRHHKSMIVDYHYYMSAYKYVYRNPVRAGLCEFAEEYRYSTLSGLCGQFPLRIPVVEDLLLFNPYFQQSTLSWINEAPKSANDDDAVRRALKKSIFLYGKNKNSELPDLETRSY